MIKIHNKTFVPYLSVEEIDVCVSNIASKINSDYANKELVFVVILNGSFMFASDLLKKIDVPCELTFVKYTSYIGVESSGKVNELIGFDRSIDGKDIIILEDIVDTGQTVEKVVSIVESKGALSIKIASLLFKPTVFQKKFAVDYVGKNIPNKFVVGYGLDYDQKGRNFGEIYQIEEEN